MTRSVEPLRWLVRDAAAAGEAVEAVVLAVGLAVVADEAMVGDGAKLGEAGEATRDDNNELSW
jgi:hypothetical protein